MTSHLCYTSVDHGKSDNIWICTTDFCQIGDVKCMYLYMQNFIAVVYFLFWLRNMYCTLDQTLADFQFGHLYVVVVSADCQCNLLSYLFTETRNSIDSGKYFVILHYEPAKRLFCMRMRKRKQEIEKDFHPKPLVSFRSSQRPSSFDYSGRVAERPHF